MTRRVITARAARGAAVATLLGLLAVLGAGCGDDATSPTMGTLTVTAATTGAEPDVDGYTLRYGVTAKAVPANGALDLTMRGGDHLVTLEGVAPNCAVAGENPRRVSVAAGGSATVAFAVTCAATGGLQVTVATTGAGADADGYVVEVVGPKSSKTVDVTADGTVTISGLPAGQYSVRLMRVAIHCAVDAPHPQTVDVASGATTGAIAFAVGCGPLTQIAFVRRSDTGAHDIWVVNSDGSGAKNLGLGSDFDPAWSPDGSHIAFASGRDGNAEIYVMRADGSSPRRLTHHSTTDRAPAWSPDGGKIAFVSGRDGNAEIYVMNADGTSPVRLTSDPYEDEDPAWSPDGTRIAFTSTRQGGRSIWVMNADGSNPTRLLDGGDGPVSHPAWSPDGGRIAFDGVYGYCPYGVVMGADGSDVTEYPWIGGEPAWSPDGRAIASEIMYEDWWGCAAGGLQVVRADGTDLPFHITDGADSSPAWRP